ncbi:MAG: PDZ domain-containing protein, partial [Cyclobacteriaceae bacterium]|nr:PDZ domain-containing protein [Cyclobacteriaceae bacterium]
EILSRFTVIFDFPNEKLYLKKNGSFKKKYYYNLSGLTIRATGLRLQTYEISDVREDTNAQRAGLLRGDEIVAINGVSVIGYELSNINDFLNSKLGKKIRVEVKRKGEKLKKMFVLESQI